MTPIPDSLVTVLKFDSTAALAAMMIVATAHRELFAWAAMALADQLEPPAKTEEPTPNSVAKQPRSAQGAARAKESRVAKPAAVGAYHARRREARREADASLIHAMQANPDASIGDWASAIGKSRTSTVSGLQRLREAGKADSVEGKWRLTEPDAPKEPPLKWVAPVRGTDRAAHPHLTA